MPIQEENIVFVESQVLDDVPEGGGAATGRVVVDGQLNNVFDDISDLDRALGRFNLRKLFLAVRSLDTDLYGGAKLVVSQLPTDPALGYTLFTTNSPFDTRAQAVNRVEAYLYKGPMWPGALQSNHIIGMRAINVIQRVGTVLPPIGKTLCLVENEGLGNQKEQYVRVVNVGVTLTTFTDTAGDFQRWIVRLDLSDALQFDFTGHDANRQDSYSYSGRVRLRDTTVADAQRYFGSREVTQSAAIGDRSVRVGSVFAQIVPSARTEIPLVAQPMNPELIQSLVAGTRTVEVPQQAHTLARPVTPENRRLNWIETVVPRPAPQTLSIAYMAEGSWYVVSDQNGTGTLAGADPAFGTGTVNYETGVINVTLGALPDSGTQIIWTWASPVHYARLDASPDIEATASLLYSVEEPIKPGTLVLTWLVGGVEKTATAGANGVITGDAGGYCSHVAGEFRIEFTVPPDFNSKLGVDYERQSAVQQTFTSVSAPGGLATVSVGEAIEPGSVQAVWVTLSTARFDGRTVRRWYTTNPSGGWNYHVKIDIASSTVQRNYRHEAIDNATGEIVDETGLVNYGTGQITLPVLPPVSERAWHQGDGRWADKGSSSENHEFTSGVINVWYTPAGAAATAVSFEVQMPPLEFRILPRFLDAVVVPNSVRFVWNGQTYSDQNGTLLRDGGVVAGTIDYLSGICTLSDYVTGAGTINVTSLLVRYGDWLAVEASFRSAVAPLLPEALNITVAAVDGEQLLGSADEHGAIVGDAMRGEVNYDTGTAWVEFGAQVGEDWVPREVDPGTIRYNAVAFSYIPLPAEILGINAVRLPPDGRVPIYRPGDVVMVMHTAETAPVTPTAGAPVSVGRTRLAWVRVIDNAGETVSGDLYELDRSAGTVTFASLDGIATPLVIRHTVGDLRLVTDTQISGELTLSRELTHPFPAAESIVAACLLFGDRRARVSAIWDQASWSGVWQDSIIGSPATATLNTIDFPITVTNEGADTDRWIFRCTNAATHAWELISEYRGLVWSGSYPPYVEGVPVDIAPINPRTRTELEPGVYAGGVPYLTIPQRANGGGWATGNVVRINTVGAIADFYIARSIQQSEEPADPAAADGCEIYALGNVDRP